jgi:rubrerythrin
VSDPVTRRAAVREGLALGGGVLAAGSVAALVTAPAARSQDEDVATLERLVELEQRAALAYREMAEGDLLEEEVRAAAELFADQEDEHVEALAAALADRGGRVPDPPAAADVEGLEDLSSQEEALELAIDLENALVRAYGEAAEAFEAPELIKTCAQILGSEGTHLVVARQQLGRDPVPEAFEEGESD